MFTGVVKLAQIDDYIAPSQNCVQPKIMKIDAKQQKATVTLNDCLACSGCITSAQSVLIQQMSVQKFMQIMKGDEKVYIVMSAQSLLSLSKFYGVQPNIFIQRFNQVLQKQYKNYVRIYNLTLATQICHQLILEQFMTRYQNKSLPVLCSECPGWVCYSEKTLTLTVTDFMSQVKSPQQIMAQLIREKFGLKCKVVSIMPCYDKKLQAIRFQYQNQSQQNQSKIKQVDLTLATIQIVQVIKRIGCQEVFKTQSNNQILNQPKFQIQKQIQQNNQEINKTLQNSNQLIFVKDQTSNGYIQFILSRLGIKDYKCEEIKNSDFVQYNFQWNGKQSKMAKCYGFRNIQKIVQLIKKNKCPYLYIQVMACPGGCFGGGGQIKFEGLKSKEIISQFYEVLKKYRIFSGQEIKLNIKDYNIDLNKTHVKYKPIEKSLTQAVLNW